MKKNGIRAGIIVIGISMLLFSCKSNENIVKTTKERQKDGNSVSLQETKTEDTKSKEKFEVLQETESESQMETLQEPQSESESKESKDKETEYIGNDLQEKTSKETQAEYVISGLQEKTSEQESKQKQTWTITEFKKTMYPTVAINIRKGPSTDFEKIGVFSKNQEVIVTGKVEETGWYRICFKNQDAFVSNKYLGETKVEEKQETDTGTKQKAEQKQEINSETKQETEQKQEINTETKDTSSEEVNKNWVSNLKVAKNAKQIIVVAASGSKANISMHNKNADGNWIEIVNTSGYVGKNGIGKSKEGDKKTPTGQYQFLFGFGIKSNPGASIRYI